MVDLEECDVLDLFAGTGSVSYEFASRGARSVTAVEINPVHHTFIAQTARTLGFSVPSFFAVKANVFNYLAACIRQFDIIFSDAPYDLAGSEKVIEMVFARGLLRPAGVVREDGSTSDGGLLIFEHSKGQNFADHPRFLQSRNYGSVQFSIFSTEPRSAE